MVQSRCVNYMSHGSSTCIAWTLAVGLLFATPSCGQVSLAGRSQVQLHVNEACPKPDQDRTDFSLLSRLLSKYVDSAGRVAYGNWSQCSEDLQTLRDQLQWVARQKLEPLSQDRAAELAFWINVYHLLALDIRLRQRLDSKTVPANIFKDVFVYVGDKSFSLDQIEHERLRRMSEPRIHFALHCGGKSCPLLENQIWDSNQLAQRLDHASREFLQSKRAAIWVEETKTLKLSQLFQWYRKDFGQGDAELVRFVSKYVSREIRERILATDPKQIRLEFLDYDWTLQEDSQTEPKVSALDSDAFPQELEHWRVDRVEHRRGLAESSRLLERLLAANSTADSKTHLQKFADIVGEFQAQMANQTQTPDPPLSVANFRLDAENLKLQWTGRMPFSEPEKIFDGFTGRWFGRWAETPVNHDWRPTTIFSPPQPTALPNQFLVADQYAWIHNGFGWNYLVVRESGQPIVLGYVCYLDENNLMKIQGRKPHVGFADLPVQPNLPITRLVWVTEQEIFLEEVFQQPDPKDTHYLITGIYHQLLASQPTVSSTAVQARYTRQSQDRPAFRTITWKPPQEFVEPAKTK